jgi:hypothetical protein
MSEDKTATYKKGSLDTAIDSINILRFSQQYSLSQFFWNVMPCCLLCNETQFNLHLQDDEDNINLRNAGNYLLVITP